MDPITMNTDHFNQPHRRFNALTGEWVFVSPHRTKRPWQGRVEPGAPPDRPSHDPQCYLCPGNARANQELNPSYDSTFVFINDFAAFLPIPKVPTPASTRCCAPARRLALVASYVFLLVTILPSRK